MLPTRRSPAGRRRCRTRSRSARSRCPIRHRPTTTRPRLTTATFVRGTRQLSARQPPDRPLPSRPASSGPDPGPAEDGSAGPGPGAPSGRARRGPDPAAGWPSQFAQVLAETLAGSRPAQQLTPWTTEQARRRIRQLGPMLATGQRPRVRRVMTSAPGRGRARDDRRCRLRPPGPGARPPAGAEQARPYRQGGSRWCCTAIESA